MALCDPRCKFKSAQFLLSRKQPSRGFAATSAKPSEQHRGLRWREARKRSRIVSDSNRSSRARLVQGRDSQTTLALANADESIATAGDQGAVKTLHEARAHEARFSQRVS